VTEREALPVPKVFHFQTDKNSKQIQTRDTFLIS